MSYNQENQSVSIDHLSKFLISCQKTDNWIAFDFEWAFTSSNNSPKCECKISKNSSEDSKHPADQGQEYNEIVTFGFEDSYYNKGSLDIADFPSSKAFLEAIKEKLLQYHYCFAWGSKAIARRNVKTGKSDGINGDLAILDSNLRKNRIPSIVNYNKFSGIPYITRYAFATAGRNFQADVDLLKVFAKPLVRLFFKNEYKSLHLDDVCKVLIGYGKLNGSTGAKLEKMSIEERKIYCMHDAHLVAELVRIRNGDILRIMRIISSHTDMSFEEVCHKGMTGIWKKMIDDKIHKNANLIGYNNISNTLLKLYSNKSTTFAHEQYDDFFEDDETGEEIYEGDFGQDFNFQELKENSFDQYMEMVEFKLKERKSKLMFTTYDNAHTQYNQCVFDKGEKSIYSIEQCKDKTKFKGGLILNPIRGLHTVVHLFDTVSMYPTIIINNNLSPETVNCACCKFNPKSILSFDDESISKDLVYLNESSDSHYWICKKREGTFSKILKTLTEKRIEYKKEGKELESLAMKMIINSGYGAFGYQKFKYYDPRVAEIATALGRMILLGIKKIAQEEMNFVVLYGDTDSLFVNGAKDKDDISRFIGICKKKLGVDVNLEKTFSKLILVGRKHYIGFPEDKNNNAVIIKGMEGIKSDRPEFIHTTFRNLVEDIKNDIDPVPRLRESFDQIDKRSISKERLSIYLTLSKNPQEYVNDCLQKRLGTMLRLKKEDTLVYYKCDKQIRVYDQLGKQQTKTISESVDPNDISYAKYKYMFIKAVQDVIEILGYSVEKDLLAKKKLILF